MLYYIILYYILSYCIILYYSTLHGSHKKKNRGSMIHVREAAPFYFCVFWNPPCDDCSPPAWGVFLQSISVFFWCRCVFLKNTVDDSLWFCCFWTPNTPFFPGALRAQDWFIFLCFAAFRHQIPQNLPARFARRMASFSYVFAALDPKYSKFFAARFARRIASFPIVWGSP